MLILGIIYRDSIQGIPIRTLLPELLSFTLRQSPDMTVSYQSMISSAEESSLRDVNSLEQEPRNQRRHSNK